MSLSIREVQEIIDNFVKENEGNISLETLDRCVNYLVCKGYRYEAHLISILTVSIISEQRIYEKSPGNLLAEKIMEAYQKIQKRHFYVAFFTP